MSNVKPNVTPNVKPKAKAKAEARLVYITIGYQSLLMAADDAVLVFRLLQGAVRCKRTLDVSARDYRFVPGDAIELEMQLVQPDQASDLLPNLPFDSHAGSNATATGSTP